MSDGGSRPGWGSASLPDGSRDGASELEMLWPDVFLDEGSEAAGVVASLWAAGKQMRSWRGESGEKEGNEVSDLSSDGATDDDALEACEVRRFRGRVEDR
jgi:hypothetical protein